MDRANITKQTKLKTTQIYPNSLGLYFDKKPKIAVAYSKGIHILDSPLYQLQSTIKSQNNVSCLTISDQLIFFACGMEIFIAAANGKIVHSFQTNLAVDKIDIIHVHGYRLWAICGNLLNQFLIGGVYLENKKSRSQPSQVNKTQDVNSHMFESKINCSLLLGKQQNKPYLFLLMNSNQIYNFQKKQLANYKTSSPPTSAINYIKQSIIVGTALGEIICLTSIKNKINVLWKIQKNSIGRINCLSLLVNNGFMVFRDKKYQFWSQNRQFLGEQQIQSKVVAAIYDPDNQATIYGTQNGDVVFLGNYQKILKQNSKKNQTKQRQQLQKIIQNLQKSKQDLKKKLNQVGKNYNKKINVKATLSLDYVRMCYCYQILSDQPINKVIIQGKFVVLDNEDLIFEGKDNNNNLNYAIRGLQKKSMLIYIKQNQQYFDNQNKANCLVYVQTEEKKDSIYYGGVAVSLDIDLKPLSLHHKANGKSNQFQNQLVSKLIITGKFKYFQMTHWLNCIFNQFGSNQGDAEKFSQCYYESIITKTKLYIRYKNQICEIYSQSVIPLPIIKKILISKSKQKNINLSYDCQTSAKGISHLFTKISPEFNKLESLHKKYALLPGLLEIKGENMSEELQNILLESDNIKNQYNRTSRVYEALKDTLKQLFIAYRQLNGHSINSYQVDNFKSKVQNCKGNWDTIQKLILS